MTRPDSELPPETTEPQPNQQPVVDGVIPTTDVSQDPNAVLSTSPRED